MFTGIIEDVGTIEAIAHGDGDLRLTVAFSAPPREALVPGESICVAGVCLTVAAADGARFTADVSTETLACTTLGGHVPGHFVNLERAVRADARFGGHIVSGHVDATGTVRSITEAARAQCWRFDAPASLRRYIAVKGSIAVDGASLTVNAVHPDGFEVMLVPHTLAHTTFGRICLGVNVNLEVDVIARYVERMVG
ncbi:MAG TPA: riboflavin synthase [Xanthomonadaceae bacterium]|nr:riboflavin synthase [Xanthomonadaceae bacterium]